MGTADAAPKVDPAEVKGGNAGNERARPPPPACTTCGKHTQFPKDVCDKMNDLMKDSYPGGHSTERGGTLVTDSAGNTQMVNAGAGNNPQSGSFSPNLNVPSGDTVQGVFHTHPYDASEGNYTNVSLSGGDAAYMINNHHSIMVARSGDGLFIYKPTADTPNSVDFTQTNNDQNARIASLVKGGMGFPEASQQAARETADRLHLEYYQGKKCDASKVN